MTIQQLEKNWKSGKPDAVYLFYGEEEFSRSEMLNRALDTFLSDVSLRAFNYDQLSGDEQKLPDLINAAKNYPVMAEMRVVICKNAEKLFKTRDPEEVEEEGRRSLQLLYDYLEDPNRNTLLIFDMEKPGPKNQHPWKDIFAKTTTVEFPSLKESAAVEWIADAQKSREIPRDKSSQCISHACWNRPSTLNSELEKLLAYSGDRERSLPRCRNDDRHFSCL